MRWEWSFTVLFCKISFRYWAPSISMVFNPILRVVNVYWKIYVYRWKSEWRNITLLIRNASMRYFIPNVPIRLYARLNVVNVYYDIFNEYRLKKRGEYICFTVLICNALAKCCTPSSPMTLLRRSSVINFYKKQTIIIVEINKRWMLLY
jgi:hypothetical protein